MLDHASLAAPPGSEETLRALFDSFDEGFCIVEVVHDGAGNPVDLIVRSANPVWVAQTGLPHAVGRHLSTLVPALEKHWLDYCTEVLHSGEAIRRENYSREAGRWFSTRYARVGEPGSNRVAVIFHDITRRKSRELHSAFLDDLGKDLAPLSDPDAIMDRAGQRIGEFLQVSACLFADVNEAESTVTAHVGWMRDGLPNLKGAYGFKDYVPEAMRQSAYAGEVYIVRDAQRDARVDAASAAALRIGAFVAVHFHWGGRWTNYLAVADTAPRDWTAAEIRLLEELASRLFLRRERARTDRARRASEERQAFLLRLSDAFRLHPDEDSVGRIAVDTLAAHLRLDRCFFNEMRADQGLAHVGPEYRSPGLPPVSGAHRYADFPAAMRRVEAGEALIVPDVARQPGFTGRDKALLRAMGIGAVIVGPLRKGSGRAIWALTAAAVAPRAWTPDDLHLVQEVAERTWSAIERARAEANLRAREADLARVQRIGQVAGLDVDLTSGAPTWRSPEYRQLHGLPADTLRETHEDWRARVHPDDRARAEAALFAVLEQGDRHEMEYRIIRPSDGAVRWIHARADVERDAAGRAIRLVGAHLDITHQKRMQEALQESEDRQAFLLRLSDALRPLSDVTMIEDTAARILGEGLLAGRAYYGYYGQADAAHQTITIRADYCRGGGPSLVGVHSVTSFDLRDEILRGRTVAVSDIQAHPLFTAASRARWAALGMRSMVVAPIVKDAAALAVLVVGDSVPRDWSRDIILIEEAAERTWAAVARARAETETARHLKLLDLAFDAADMGAWDYDLATGICRYDARAQKLYNLPTDSLDHRPESVAAVVHPDDVGPMFDALQRAMDVDGDGRYDIDYRITQGEGRYRWLRAWGQAEFAGEGADRRGVRIVGASRDITPEKDAAARLAADLAAAQQLQAVSTAFISEQEPDTLYAQLLDAAMALMRADAASVQILEPRSNRLRLSAARHFHADSAAFWEWVDARSETSCGQALRDGSRVVITDLEAAPALAGTPDLAAYRRSGLRAVQSTPLVGRDGAPLGMISTHWRRPHRPGPRDFDLFDVLARQAADLIARTRAIAALRESEERFQQFAAASAGALWIRDARTLALEYVSPATQRIYGVEPAALLGNVKRWAALIVPDDRDAALAHIQQVLRGEAAVHEFRIQRPDDGAFRWIRNTCFPLLDDQGRVQRVGGIFEDATEEKLAAEHQGVLLAELQHRVRNIMAIVRSIAARTGDHVATVPEYAETMAGRLLAIARVQTLLTRAADQRVGIATLVREEIAARAQHAGQYTIAGPDIVLSPKAAEVLSLALHELATNAVKYGALSSASGHVAADWHLVAKRGAPWLSFDWRERGGPATVPDAASPRPRRRGFGSELIEGRIPYELGGVARMAIGPEGAWCHLEFPLAHGASILETGAPQRATVLGGALDMTGEADLTGRHILVVEDDYYLATDTARALQGAGAAVLGPFPSETAAEAELDERRPDAAVVDINLGLGPSFRLAQALKARGVPFVFVTGYDQGAIPDSFRDIERLEKPVPLRRIVGAVARLLDRPA